MPWEMKDTPKVGDRLAVWIWILVAAIVVAAAVGIVLWKQRQAPGDKPQPTGGAPTSRIESLPLSFSRSPNSIIRGS